MQENNIYTHVCKRERKVQCSGCGIEKRTNSLRVAVLLLIYITTNFPILEVYAALAEGQGDGEGGG